jgi:hypothetical protein
MSFPIGSIVDGAAAFGHAPCRQSVEPRLVAKQAPVQGCPTTKLQRHSKAYLKRFKKMSG